MILDLLAQKDMEVGDQVMNHYFFYHFRIAELYLIFFVCF
jgi:hypothetical protein